MSSAKGLSVRLFLVDGTPAGMITAEIGNWSGHVLAGSRSALAAFLERSELDRTGLYFLTGREPTDPDTTVVYIGESNNVRGRLKQHNTNESRDYWERTCVVTSKDNNITKAHGRYLESRLIQLAKEAGRATIANSTEPPLENLPESDKSDMEHFIAQMKIVLPVLGFDFLKPTPKVEQLVLASSDGPVKKKTKHKGFVADPVFELNSAKRKLKATAKEIDGDFVVYAGSQAAIGWTQEGSKSSTYGRLHERLLTDGKLKHSDATASLIFAENVPFSSPSAASAVIFGRADNGRKSWKVQGRDMDYDEWQKSQSMMKEMLG